MSGAVPACGGLASGAPLTREDTAALLDRRGTPPHAFHLYGAHMDDAVVLDHRADQWVVFHSERGGENDLRRHATQDEACRDLLGRLSLIFRSDAATVTDPTAGSP